MGDSVGEEKEREEDEEDVVRFEVSAPEEVRSWRIRGFSGRTLGAMCSETLEYDREVLSGCVETVVML